MVETFAVASGFRSPDRPVRDVGDVQHFGLRSGLTSMANSIGVRFDRPSILGLAVPHRLVDELRNRLPGDDLVALAITVA